MTPKWQQSEEAAAAGRSLSEGRIMSVQGQKHFFPGIWQNHGQLQLKIANLPLSFSATIFSFSTVFVSFICLAGCLAKTLPNAILKQI